MRKRGAESDLSIDARAGNVFDELRGLERLRERFDTIVLDPPAFAKSKSAVEKATAGYKEINLRALKLLNPGGILVTCSCSYNVNEAAFAEIVYAAAVDAQAQVTVVEKRMQGRDHPVCSGCRRRARNTCCACCSTRRLAWRVSLGAAAGLACVGAVATAVLARASIGVDYFATLDCVPMFVVGALLAARRERIRDWWSDLPGASTSPGCRRR